LQAAFAGANLKKKLVERIVQVPDLLKKLYIRRS